jgi:hypothetical protein
LKRWSKRGLAGQIATVAALALIGVLWARLLLVHPEAEEVFHPADAARVQIAQRKLDEVSGAVNQLKAASQRGEKRTRVLRLSDADINGMLAAQPEVLGALEDAQVRDLLVRIEDGRIITIATVQKGQMPVSLRADGYLAARSGMLLYASSDVRIGGLPAPETIRTAVDTRIQAAFRQFEQQSQARVDRVSVTGDRITLRLSSRPE